MGKITPDINLLYPKVKKIFKGKVSYAHLSLRQTRRLIKLFHKTYGNINMMDFHQKLMAVLESYDLPF